MTKLKNVIKYKNPDTYKIARNLQEQQKPYRTAYSTEAYEKAIEYAAQNHGSEHTPDLNLRVDRAIKEQQTTILPVHRENNWFAREVKELSRPKVYYTVSTSFTQHCSVTGTGQYEEGTTCTLVMTPETHYHPSMPYWVNVPASASISSDYLTCSFTVDADYTSVGATCSEDPKRTFTFLNDGNCTVIDTSTGTEITTWTDYDGEQKTISVTPNAHYQWSQWSDGETANPRIFTMSGSTSFTAQCTAASQHTLTFVAVNGTVSQSSFTGYEGDAVSITATGNTGSTWVGWSDGGTDQSRTFTVGTEDKTYTATYNSAGQYTLSFLTTTGGSVSPTTHTGVPGSTVSVTCTSDTHYTFSQWSDGDTSNPRTFTVGTEDKTHTAQFAEDPLYEMTVSATNGSVLVTKTDGSPTPAPWKGYAGDQFKITFSPSTHYHFTQWSDGNTDNPRTITLNATSNAYSIEGTEDTKYTLTFNTDPSASGSCSPSSYTGYEGDTVVVTVTPGSHYSFDQWDDGNTSNPRTVTVATSAVTYTANLKEDAKYTLTFTADPAAGATMSTSSFTGYTGDTVAVTVTPNTGYTFNQWADVASITIDDGTTFLRDSSEDNIDPTLGVMVYAWGKDTAIRFGTLSETPAVGDALYSKDPGTTRWYLETTYSLISVASHTENPRTFTVGTEDKTYTAKLVSVGYTITLKNDGHGHVENSAGETITSITGATGETFTVTAVPNSGYRFSYWSDGISLNPRIFTVGTEDKTVTANFAELGKVKFEGGSSFTTLKCENDDATTWPYLQYSSDGLNDWTTWTSDTITVTGSTVYVRGKCSQRIGTFTGNYTHVSGALIALADYEGDSDPVDQQFLLLFSGCTTLTSLSGLIFPFDDTHTEVCSAICSNCSNLSSLDGIYWPSDIGDHYFANAFTSCTSLTNLGSAEIFMNYVGEYGFSQAFLWCNQLTTPPVLNVAECEAYAFSEMYCACTSLLQGSTPVGLTEPPANAFAYMFKGCTALTYLYAENVEVPSLQTDWLLNASSSGTFTVAEDAHDAWVALGRSTSAIPTGWTIQDF